MASRCALEKDHRIARMSKRLELYRFKGIVMVLLEVGSWMLGLYHAPDCVIVW